MGKGDKRSRRGKIFAGSFGKTRPKHKKKHVAANAASSDAAAPKKAPRKKKAE
jgi:30S ribosomal protein S31